MSSSYSDIFLIYIAYSVRPLSYFFSSYFYKDANVSLTLLFSNSASSFFFFQISLYFSIVSSFSLIYFSSVLVTFIISLSCSFILSCIFCVSTSLPTVTHLSGYLQVRVSIGPFIKTFIQRSDLAIERLSTNINQ